MNRTRFVLLVAWLGWVFDIMDTALFNFARGPMLTHMLGADRYVAIGPAWEGQIHTGFLIGWALGGLFFGVMADRWGRTRTLMATILLYCLFTGATAFCQTPDQVLVIRFLTGLGIGGEWAAGAALVAESFADDERPLAAAILQTAAAVGPWLASALNALIMRPGVTYGTLMPWQMLYLVGLAPAVVALMIRLGVPEPPRRVEAGSAWSGLRELFREPQWARRAWLVLGIGAVGIAGAGNAVYWLPNLVRGVTEDPALVSERLTWTTSILHIGTLVGVFVFPAIAKRSGRRVALGTGFALALVSTALLLLIPMSYTTLLGLSPVIAFSAIGVSAVFGLYFPELFPARIRATGAGFGYNFARLLQAPLPWLTGLLIAQNPSQPFIGVGIAASVYVIGLLLLLVAPETKGEPLPT